jgi:hypothetical protein
MARSQRLFGRRRLLDSDVEQIPARRPSEDFSRSERLPRDLEYNVDDEYASPKVARDLRSLGYDQDRVRETLRAVSVLRETVDREINPVVFARIQVRYRVNMRILAALASICRQEAADLGLVLRSLVLFYRRNRMKESDLRELERFVNWVVSRGETIRGVPSAWEEYQDFRRRRRSR